MPKHITRNVGVYQAINSISSRLLEQFKLEDRIANNAKIEEVILAYGKSADDNTAFYDTANKIAAQLKGELRLPYDSAIELDNRSVLNLRAAVKLYDATIELANEIGMDVGQFLTRGYPLQYTNDDVRRDIGRLLEHAGSIEAARYLAPIASGIATDS